MDLREVLAALRTRWWQPLLGAFVGAPVAVVVVLVQTPLYTSSTQLFVSATGSTSVSDALQGSQFSQDRVSSYARLLAGKELAGRVIDRLRLPLTRDQLRSEISATPVADTVLIDVSVTDRSPEQAQIIATAVGAEFSTMVADLETPAGGGASTVKVTVTDRPDIPTQPSSPRKVLDIGLGVILGLLVGAAVAIVRARLDRSVKDPAELAELAGAPVIGTVLRDEALQKQHTIERGTTSRTAENYRQLRTNLQFLNVDDPPKVILVSSAVPSEGKTTMVINLALSLVDAGRRVVIVEADLRRPKVSPYLGVVGDVGLTNILTGAVGIEDVVQLYRERLAVIAAGPLPPNPGELLASTQMSAVLEKLRAQNDFVLIDAPPLLPVADTSGLAAFSDGVLLSVRHGSTRKEQVQQAAATLQRVGARTLGVVLNIVPPRAEAASTYDYGYEGRRSGDARHR
jgi:capsular exopolysaccharide synthesis family protein